MLSEYTRQSGFNFWMARFRGEISYSGQPGRCHLLCARWTWRVIRNRSQIRHEFKVGLSQVIVKFLGKNQKPIKNW